jgi:hypothetical protein
MRRIRAEAKDAGSPANDPIARARRLLEGEATSLTALEENVQSQILAAVKAALAE